MVSLIKIKKEVFKMGDNYIRSVLDGYKSLIERLQLIEIDDPVDYLKQVVVNLMKDDDGLYRFDDSGQLYSFMKDFIRIKNFFEEGKYKDLKSIKSYLSALGIPITLTELATKKRIMDAHFELIDVNEVILNDNSLQAILNDFENLKIDFTDNFISKHKDINQHYGDFGENLMKSSEFILLIEFCSIDQITHSLLNPPSRLLQEIKSIRTKKCSIGVRELRESIEKKPICSRCNMKISDLYDNEVFTFLASQIQQIKEKINESLLSTLEIIWNHEEGINKILIHEDYGELENLINFFNAIFDFFNNKADEEITNIFVDHLFELFSEKVIEIIKKAFEEEPVIIVIDLINDIVESIENRMYSEEEFMTEFQKKIEFNKENKKQEKYSELQLGPNDDKPVIHFSFRKR